MATGRESYLRSLGLLLGLALGRPLRRHGGREGVTVYADAAWKIAGVEGSACVGRFEEKLLMNERCDSEF